MKKKVAFFLPTWANHSLIEYLMTAFASTRAEDEELVLAVPQDMVTRQQISAIYGKQAFVREYYWLDADRKSMRFVYQMDDDSLGINKRLVRYARPADTFGGYDFLDCDVWRFWGVPHEKTIAPLRPTEIFYLGEDDISGQLDPKWADKITIVESTSGKKETVSPLISRRARAFSYRLAQKVYVPDAGAAHQASSAYLFDIGKCHQATLFPNLPVPRTDDREAKSLVIVTDQIKSIKQEQWERAYRLWLEESNGRDIYIAIEREKKDKSDRKPSFLKDDKSDKNQKLILESIQTQHGRSFINSVVLYEYNEFDMKFFTSRKHVLYVPSWSYKYMPIFFLANSLGATIYTEETPFTRYLAQQMGASPNWLRDDGRIQ